MRSSYVIAGCMLAGAALSWIVAPVSGDLSAQSYRSMIWPYAAFGLLAALAGWAHLEADVRGPAGARWKACVGVAVAIHLAAALSMPFTSGDLWSNLAYGRMSALGINPYLAGPSALPVGDQLRKLVHSIWIDLPMPYGPLLGLLELAPGAAAATPWAGMLLFKVLMAAASLGAVLMAARYCQARFAGDEALERFVLFGWCPLLAWELTGQAHNDAILVACLIGFVWAATSERELTAVIFLALALAAKFVVAPVAGFYLLAMARRAPARAALFGAGIATVAVGMMLPWWHGVSTLKGFWTNVAPVAGHSSQSMGALVTLIGGLYGEEAGQVAFRAFSVIGVGTLASVALFAVTRVRTAASAIHYAMLFFLCGDLFSQAWFQPWYLTWLLALSLGHPDGRWLRLMGLYAALSLATYIAPIDPVSSVAVDLYIGWRVIKLAREGAPDPVACSQEAGGALAAGA